MGLSLLEGVDPTIEDTLINAKIRNVLQLALKQPYHLIELGISVETARSIAYVDQSQYGMDFFTG